MKKELLKEIIRYGSPVYAYDETILRNNCKDLLSFATKLEEILHTKVRMHYSTKSNSNLTLMKIIKEEGLSVDCMSPIELAIDEKVGFTKEDILYVCNNITAEEMKMVSEKQLLLCLDSISQVETYGKICPNTEIMVRINPEKGGVGHSKKVITAGKETKFGISEENISKLFEVAEKYQMNIVGIHQHLGSLFLNDKIEQYILGVKSGLEIAKKYFKNLKIIDLGGGFGVPYRPEEERLDFNLLENQLIPVLQNFLAEYGKIEQFNFEPGRYIPCTAGFLVGTVTSIKENDGKIWIGTDIGMNTLIRPAMYDAYHEIEIITQEPTEKVTANICGNICESGDVLGKDRAVNRPQVGDFAIVYNAGAYGYVMSSSYTGRLKPAEVLIKQNSTIQLIRKPETLEDILEGFNID